MLHLIFFHVSLFCLLIFLKLIIFQLSLKVNLVYVLYIGVRSCDRPSKRTIEVSSKHNVFGLLKVNLIHVGGNLTIVKPNHLQELDKKPSHACIYAGLSYCGKRFLQVAKLFTPEKISPNYIQEML